MARTHRKVRYSPSSKESKHTPSTAASGVEQAFKFLEGRWKLVILFHLFGGKMLRFSDLERAIPAISQKMLIQQWNHHARRRSGRHGHRAAFDVPLFMIC
jgi:DNA-binding HxlR family transcriptional regulator